MKEFYLHESSYVDKKAIIGKGTKIWHFSHVQSNAILRKLCIRSECKYIE